MAFSRFFVSSPQVGVELTKTLSRYIVGKVLASESKTYKNRDSRILMGDTNAIIWLSPLYIIDCKDVMYHVRNDV